MAEGLCCDHRKGKMQAGFAVVLRRTCQPEKTEGGIASFYVNFRQTEHRRVAMATSDSLFAGAIPRLYDTLMVPML